MKKTKTFKPYTGDKCTLQSTGAGVYIIYKSGEPVYIGYSAANVKKTMYRHFQSWDDPSQKRVTFKQLAAITCRVIFCNTAKQAAILEEALILKHKPRFNELKLSIYSAPKKAEVLEDYFEAVEAPF